MAAAEMALCLSLTRGQSKSPSLYDNAQAISDSGSMALASIQCTDSLSEAGQDKELPIFHRVEVGLADVVECWPLNHKIIRTAATRATSLSCKVIDRLYSFSSRSRSIDYHPFILKPCNNNSNDEDERQQIC